MGVFVSIGKQPSLLMITSDVAQVEMFTMEDVIFYGLNHVESRLLVLHFLTYHLVLLVFW